MEGFAGRLAAIEVSGAAPTPTPSSSDPATLGLHAASRRSSGPALHEARTLLGAGAGSSRIRFPGKPTRAIQSKTDVPPHQPLDLHEELAKLEAALEEEFGVDLGVATTETEYTEALIGGGSEGKVSSGWATSTHPSRVPWNNHCDAREESTEGPADSSQGVLEPSATSASPLRANPTFTRGHRDGRRTFHDDRIGGVESQHAMLYHICRIFEYAAKDNGHDLAKGSLLVGLSGPDARPDVHLSPASVSAVVAWHREAKSGEPLRRRPRRQPAKADSRRGEIRRSSRTAKTGGQGRKGQRRRGTLRPGRDPHDAGPAELRGRTRRFPPNLSGWTMFFSVISSFSRETEFTNLSREEIATSRARHTSGRGRIPMPASPRHRAWCNRHEAPAGIRVEVWALVTKTALSLPACWQ